MWIRNIFTFSQSLFPVTLPPSCPQKPLESRQNLPRDVRRPATDCLIRNSNVRYWKRFLGEILSLETGGMGGGGRSGSRQRGGWNPGPLPSSHGQERLFQRFSGNQVLTQGGYLVVISLSCPIVDISQNPGTLLFGSSHGPKRHLSHI